MGSRLGAKRRATFRYHEHLQRRLHPIAGSTRRAGPDPKPDSLLDAAAQAHNATPAQVALAWQSHRPGLTAPICSATSTAQWAELAGAARLVLAPATLAALDAASAEAADTAD